MLLIQNDLEIHGKYWVYRKEKSIIKPLRIRLKAIQR